VAFRPHKGANDERNGGDVEYQQCAAGGPAGRDGRDRPRPSKEVEARGPSHTLDNDQCVAAEDDRYVMGPTGTKGSLLKREQ
jgi:hypothetical protein